MQFGPSKTYDLPSIRVNRASGFGIGDRFKEKIDKKSWSPSPDSHVIPSLFSPDLTTSTFANHMRVTTYSFGTGREGYAKTVTNRYHMGPDKGNPGPKYMTIKPLG